MRNKLIASLFLVFPLLLGGGGDFGPAQEQHISREWKGNRGGIDWTTIIVATIGTIGSIITGVFGYRAVKNRGKTDDEGTNSTN